MRLDRVATDACAALRVAHPARTLELELEPATVTGDAGRLNELVHVLVDNAIKYSPPGSDVTVGVVDGSIPRLTVRDHGPGMSLADRQRAFDRFFRGANAAGVQGSGLGLAIAQAISERHGATLALEDANGGGTLASVSFASAPPTD